jgi:hypothetical protein
MQSYCCLDMRHPAVYYCYVRYRRVSSGALIEFTRYSKGALFAEVPPVSINVARVVELTFLPDLMLLALWSG